MIFIKNSVACWSINIQYNSFLSPSIYNSLFGFLFSCQLIPIFCRIDREEARRWMNFYIIWLSINWAKKRMIWWIFIFFLFELNYLAEIPGAFFSFFITFCSYADSQLLSKLPPCALLVVKERKKKIKVHDFHNN